MADKKKGGRPSKYETHVKPNLELVEQLARNGATDDEIARKLGIAVSSLYDYKAQFAEFAEVLKKGKDVVDTQVENALLKRALGYEYEEITEEFVGGELRNTKVVRKQIVPDVGAQCFWLKNRQPDKWRDRQEVGITAGTEELREAYDKVSEALKKQ